MMLGVPMFGVEGPAGLSSVKVTAIKSFMSEPAASERLKIQRPRNAPVPFRSRP